MSGLFGSGILEVGIGLVFLYLLIALIVSVLNELIAQMVGLRATTLEQGLRRLLTGSTSATTGGMVAKLYDHPLIVGISSINGTSKPSYIPSRQFALALLDIVAPGAQENTPDYWGQVRGEIQKIENQQLKVALTSLLDSSHNDVRAFRSNVEGWFNDAMDRVSGWYKRKVQLISLALALVLTVLLNADTVGAARTLWDSPALRSGVVSAAQDYASHSPAPNSDDFSGEVKQIGGGITQIQDSRLPIGWSTPLAGPAGWLSDAFGLLLTTLAVSLGAPFWFDVLTKFMSFRNTGPPPASGPTPLAASAVAPTVPNGALAALAGGSPSTSPTPPRAAGAPSRTEDRAAP